MFVEITEDLEGKIHVLEDKLRKEKISKRETISKLEVERDTAIRQVGNLTRQY